MDEPQNVLALPQAPDAIELRHLRAFVAVADDLSFSRAAQRLFISQPALSRQIRGLERLVGCDLFRRSTQRVELTLAGEALLARAQALLADLDDAISVTRSVGGELAGRMALLWEPWARASADVADLDGIRAALEELHGQFTPPSDVAVAPVIAGGVPALRVTPETASPAAATVLFLHGGGYVAGSAFGYRHLAAAIATAAQAPALVIDYRLAPEHPYPAAVQDAVNAYLWLRDTGGDQARIVVAGAGFPAGLLAGDGAPPGPGLPGRPPGRRSAAQPATDVPGRAAAAAHPGRLRRRRPAGSPAAGQARDPVRGRRQHHGLPGAHARLPRLLELPARGQGRHRPAWPLRPRRRQPSRRVRRPPARLTAPPAQCHNCAGYNRHSVTSDRLVVGS